jgi:hypothetical protein
LLFILLARKAETMGYFVGKKRGSGVDVIYLVGKESGND